MFNILHYDLDRDTAIEKSMMLIKIKRKKKRQLKKHISIQQRSKFTIMDLIAIFTDEAEKVCANKAIAHTIALESLSDYVKNHVCNLKVVSYNNCPKMHKQ